MAQRDTTPGQNSASSSKNQSCPDCESGFEFLTLRDFFSRRDFMKAAGATALAAGTMGLPNVLVRSARSAEATAGVAAAEATPETLVKQLYKSLRPEQKSAVAFAWDHVDSKRGLLRTHVSNNWNITDKMIASDFYSQDQQDMIRAIYEGLFQPDWIPQIDRQLKDDGQGYGKSQSIAMFGNPDEGKFEMVMTGRHMTVRVDGHSIDHMAFGGPVFHGHAATGFNEAADHPGNVFWPQALAANKIYEMLDGKQRKVALQARLPAEAAVDFHGENGPFPGLPVKQLTHDQRAELEKTLAVMLSPYRSADSDDVKACLKRQGGVDSCSLAFYQAGDVGDDGVWDNWRLEGPSFVWYFRGSPHVHLWMNIGDSAEVKTNAQG